MILVDASRAGHAARWVNFSDAKKKQHNTRARDDVHYTFDECILHVELILSAISLHPYCTGWSESSQWDQNSG